MEQVKVWFPGLGFDGPATLNKVAFTLFGKLEVRWYGLLITIGIVLAFLYAVWRGKKSEGLVPDDIMDVGILCVVLSIIGARLYYVLTSLDHYHSFYDVIAIWEGGLAIYGGLIGGVAAVVIMCRIKKLNVFKLLDAVILGVMIGQILGRWGNFANGEAYGYEIANGQTTFFFFLKEFTLPAGKGTLFHWLRMGLLPNEFSTDMAFVHPTFLYESVWNLIGFGLLNLLYRKKQYQGQITLAYLTWYGFGRMFVEGLRTDSLYIFKGIFGTDGIRISQLVGLLCFVGGTAAMIAIAVYRRKHPEFAQYLPPPAQSAAPSAVSTGEIQSEAGDNADETPEQEPQKPVKTDDVSAGTAGQTDPEEAGQAGQDEQTEQIEKSKKENETDVRKDH